MYYGGKENNIPDITRLFMKSQVASRKVQDARTYLLS